MKNLIYLLTLSLFVCMSCSKDEPIESVSLEEPTTIDFKAIAEFMKGEEANVARASLSKGDNNGNGVFFVSAVTSLFNNHGFFYPIPGTDLFMALDSPSDGRDRGIILDDTHMRLNWNIRNPRILMYDGNTGLTKYAANWCDEENTGLFFINIVVAYTPIDINNDGEYDIYLYRLISEDNVGGNSAILKVKATLTDSTKGNVFVEFPYCGVATEEVEFSYIIKAPNAEDEFDFTIDATFK